MTSAWSFSYRELSYHEPQRAMRVPISAFLPDGLAAERPIVIPEADAVNRSGAGLLTGRPRPPHFHLMGTRGDFGTICGVQFFHDIANVHLDGALAHFQLVRDDLVGFPQLDPIKNRFLSSCEWLD